MTASPVSVPTVRQLRVRLRQTRRGHHSRSLGDFLTDLYILAWFVLMYGGVLVKVGRDYLHSPSGGRADAGERYWICVAAVLAGAGLAWQGLRMVGPLLVTPAAQTWAVSAPIDRRAWLLPRFGVLTAAAAVGIAALGASAAAMGAARDLADLGWAALAGASCGVAGAALSVVAQGARQGRRWPRLPGVALTGGGATVAIVVVAAHFAGRHLGHPLVRPLTAAIAGAGLPLAVAATTFGARALPRVDRATLTTGAQFATAAVTAAVWLDPSLLAGVLESRRWRGIGRVRSRPFRPGGRWWALLQADVRRLYRHPSAIVTWSALVLGQYAVAVALPSVAGVTHVIGAYLAADRLTGGLRTLSRSPGLRRALGGSETALRLVHLVVPAVGAALWWLITVPVGGAHLGGVEILLVAGVVGAVYRAATRPPMVHGGAVVETPFGLIPVDLLRQLTRGLDVLAVLVIAQTLLT
ncbi:MAG: hypothetical protein JWP76_198 [Dactylosporangium sp.]|nr:hypothetical protein [Dactylosporangium sp.]